jgi:hypothetical protein
MLNRALVAFGLLLAASLAVAQVPGQLLISPIQFTAGTGSFPFNGPAQVSGVPASGGTFTCTGGGTPTVTNSRVTANTVVMFGLKTAAGTPAMPFMSAVTAGTSFVVTCGGSDTSVYNYVILG